MNYPNEVESLLSLVEVTKRLIRFKIEPDIQMEIEKVLVLCQKGQFQGAVGIAIVAHKRLTRAFRSFINGSDKFFSKKMSTSKNKNRFLTEKWKKRIANYSALLENGLGWEQSIGLYNTMDRLIEEELKG